MYGAGAAFFTLEPELTQVGRSRSQSRLLDLGHLEPELEPPKKVAAPQHWVTPYCAAGHWAFIFVNSPIFLLFNASFIHIIICLTTICTAI